MMDVTPDAKSAQEREALAAAVAHDLRNPLQSLLIQLDVLLREAGPDTATVPTSRLTMMRTTATRLVRMVRDLLDASRLELQRLDLEVQTVHLPELCAGLITQITPTLGTRRAELWVEGDVPPIEADPLRIEQVLTNLIDNAAKHSRSKSSILVRVGRQHRGVLMSVEDQGSGISPEDLPRLFERYFQTPAGREQRGGLGLGLFICKGLVEAHRGRIWVESTPGVGSTFYVWLPCA